jgi:hypothetical protein
LPARELAHRSQFGAGFEQRFPGRALHVGETPRDARA